MLGKVKISDSTIEDSYTRYHRIFKGEYIVGFYDTNEQTLQVVLAHGKYLFEILKAISKKYSCIDANKAYHNLTWIAPY